MRKLLLFIVTVSLCTFALAKPVPSYSEFAGQDFYSQTIAAQADLHKSALAFTGFVAPPDGQLASLGHEGMAAGANAQSARNEDDDFYSQKIAEQADLNRSVWATIAPSDESNAQFASLGESQPGSMASNQQSLNADEDSYSQTIARQALRHSRVVALSRF